MLGVDQAKQVIDIMTNPGKNTVKTYKVKDSLVWYYKLAVLPLIVSLILGVIFAGTLAAFVGHFHMGALATTPGHPVVFAIVFVLLFFLLFLPVGFLIDAAIFQLFGKYIFKQFKADYAHTFSAIVYGASPNVLFYWLILIPFLGLLFLIIAIWSLVVLIFAMANQQKISKLKVIGVIVGTVIVVIVIELIVRALVYLL